MASRLQDLLVHGNCICITELKMTAGVREYDLSVHLPFSPADRDPQAAILFLSFLLSFALSEEREGEVAVAAVKKGVLAESMPESTVLCISRTMDQVSAAFLLSNLALIWPLPEWKACAHSQRRLEHTLHSLLSPVIKQGALGHTSPGRKQ